MIGHMRIAFVFVGAAALGLSACGKSGGDASSGASEGSPAQALQAKDADTPNEAMDVYVSQMDRIADAIESVDDEASAEKAAQVIQSANIELQALSAKFEDMSEAQRTAWAMANMKKLSDVQMRIGLAMQKIATQDPERMQLLSKAMSDLPKVQ